MKKIFLFSLILSNIFFFNAAVTAFADSGGQESGRTLTAEEKKIVGIWTEPPITYITDKWGYKTMIPMIDFYDTGRGQLSLTDDISNRIISFHFDPETSEYVLLTDEFAPITEGNLDYAEMGRARLVPGTPEKLDISGTFIDRETRKRVHYKYELARESDAKSMSAPSSPGWFREEESEWAWLAGKWKTISGDPVVVTFEGSSSVWIYYSDDDQRLYDDDGNTIYNNASAVWDDDEKAFRLLSIAQWGDARRSINHDFGYLRPSSGEFAPSETLELEYYESSHAFRAVLEKENSRASMPAPIIAHKPPVEESIEDPDERAAGPSYTLDAQDADLSEARNVIVEPYDPPFNLGGWQVSNVVTFHIDVENAGDYRVTLNYSKQEYDGDRADLKLTVGGKDSVSAFLPFTGSDWSNYREHEFAPLFFPAGETTLTIESTNPRGDGYVMNLRSVTMSPMGGAAAKD